MKELKVFFLSIIIAAAANTLLLFMLVVAFTHDINSITAVFSDIALISINIGIAFAIISRTAMKPDMVFAFVLFAAILIVPLTLLSYNLISSSNIFSPLKEKINLTNFMADNRINFVNNYYILPIGLGQDSIDKAIITYRYQEKGFYICKDGYIKDEGKNTYLSFNQCKYIGITSTAVSNTINIQLPIFSATDKMNILAVLWRDRVRSCRLRVPILSKANIVAYLKNTIYFLILIVVSMIIVSPTLPVVNAIISIVIAWISVFMFPYAIRFINTNIESRIGFSPVLNMLIIIGVLLIIIVGLYFYKRRLVLKYIEQ